MNTVGQRLDKTTVQKASGRTVGCRFYGLQHPTADCPEVSCLKPEDLPGPNQPAVEIDTTRYRSAAQARAAFIAGVQGVRSPERQSVGGIAVLCYETDFYAKDHGTDSGCAAAKGTVVLLVRTVSPASVGGLGIAFSVTDKVLSAL